MLWYNALHIPLYWFVLCCFVKTRSFYYNQGNLVPAVFMSSEFLWVLCKLGDHSTKDDSRHPCRYIDSVVLSSFPLRLVNMPKNYRFLLRLRFSTFQSALVFFDRMHKCLQTEMNSDDAHRAKYIFMLDVGATSLSMHVCLTPFHSSWLTRSGVWWRQLVFLKLFLF